LPPYLYAVDRPDQVPLTASEEDVVYLRDKYRRSNLRDVAPDAEDGSPPVGDWIQVVGSAYDRASYAFGIETTAEQDDEFIQKFNSRANHRHFNIFFHNCADFARQTVDFYYPRAIHRSPPVRGVLESLVKSKRYAVPLISVAVLYPPVGGGLAFAWLDSAHFNPRRIADHESFSSEPAAIAHELESNRVATAGAAQ